MSGKLRGCSDRSFLALALALALAGCTKGGYAEQPSRVDSSRGGGDRGAVAVFGGGQTPASTVLKEELRSWTKRQQRLANRSASMTDPRNDAGTVGDVPGYVDILEASVAGEAPYLSLTLVMSGAVPVRMPDETTAVVVSWNLAGGRGHPAVGLMAQASVDGWEVSAAAGPEVVDFPGTLEVEGRKIAFVMPWSFIGGPRSFEWSAAFSYWSTSGSEPAGSGDNVPAGRYP